MSAEAVRAALKAASPGIRAKMEGAPRVDAPAPVAAPPVPVRGVQVPQEQALAPAIQAPVQPVVTPPRDPSTGQFKPDPNAAAMREVIKSQKARADAAEARLAELERARPMAPATTTPVQDPDAEVLARMTPENRKWWDEIGSKLADSRAKKIADAALEPWKPALEAAGALRKNADANGQRMQSLNGWLADKMVEGEVVDQDAMLAGLGDCERAGWRFGRTDDSHFEQVLKMVKQSNPAAVAPIVQGAAATEAARKEAEARARAGGIAPGSTVVPPPSNELAESGKKIRDASWSGDQNTVQELLRQRIRGVKGLLTFGAQSAE